MDFELTEEQRAFAQTARDFAQAEFAPHAAHWDEEGIFPKEAIAKAGELGFCGLYAPEAAGGLALPRLDATLVFEEMAAVDPSTTAFITIHNMATWMLGTWATPAVRDHWGPLLTTGEKLASYCLTEPGAGSDAASLKTRAELVGNEYVINGSKAFISGAGSTDVLVLMARTGDAQSGASGISAFAVPAAVVNDLALLASLDARGLRDGLVEAVKVSLLKDPVFFANLEKESALLAAGNIPAIGRAVRRSAPTADLVHCRVSSIRLIRAEGVSHTMRASMARSSNACSGGVSRTS